MRQDLRVARRLCSRCSYDAASQLQNALRVGAVDNFFEYVNYD